MPGSQLPWISPNTSSPVPRICILLPNSSISTKSRQNTALASPPNQTLGLSDRFPGRGGSRGICENKELRSPRVRLYCVFLKNRRWAESTYELCLNNTAGEGAALVSWGWGAEAWAPVFGFGGRQGQRLQEQTLVSGTDLGKDLSQ